MAGGSSRHGHGKLARRVAHIAVAGEDTAESEGLGIPALSNQKSVLISAEFDLPREIRCSAVMRRDTDFDDEASRPASLPRHLDRQLRHIRAVK
ncbi:hypothetical protein GCM10010446_18220 [Streptomyces enissocaesilis]|uniref:Uncharacterized protein n=1 Tax=Streptomyces enissocaesilis TaxID=332589 RepID=A0ABN3X2Q7_9ACTN